MLYCFKGLFIVARSGAFRPQKSLPYSDESDVDGEYVKGCTIYFKLS